METRAQRGPGLTWTEGEIDSQVDEAILSMNVSYSMDMATEVSLSVLDQNFAMARNNYFWITRDAWWTSDTMAAFGEYSYQARMALYVQQLMEIGSASLSQGPGSSPVWEIQLRTKAIQQMKRDRSKITNTNASGAVDMSTWVKETVQKFGLIPVIEAGSEAKMSTGSEGVQHFQYGKERGESRWDVIRRLASSAKGEDKERTQFVAFEANGYFFYGSQAWLLGKWGTETATGSWMDPKTSQRAQREFTYVPVQWPSQPDDIIQLHQIPNIRRSDNDPLEVTGSMNVGRFSGTSLRPGMTIHLTIRDEANNPVNFLGGFFLIDRVEYEQMSSNPVTVNFRSPERAQVHIREYAVEGLSAATR